jgi:A/G-specific adenine glycosylase
MLQQKLQNWYQIHRRNLPWRHTTDAYTIWLSEIILQQTRVSQGLPYFEKFYKNYPKVTDLANAPQDEVLKLWQGLGYYSRGRNMHFTAQWVVKNYKSQFPNTYQELIKLKGIGSYTAAAIASFSNNEKVAVLDGNVFRVLARFYVMDTPINTNLGKKVFEEKAALFLDKKNPGLHNQAMMELGALVCTPKNPSCFNCPLSEACLAFTTNSQERYPVKEKKLVVKPKFFYYFNLNHKQNIALFKRPAGGIWQGLYDLPLLSSDVSLTPEGLQKEVKLQLGLNLKMKDLNECQWSTKHLLTHQRIQAYYFSLKIDPELLIFPQEILWVNKKDLTTYATSRLLEKYWEATQFN